MALPERPVASVSVPLAAAARRAGAAAGAARVQAIHRDAPGAARATLGTEVPHRPAHAAAAVGAAALLAGARRGVRKSLRKKSVACWQSIRSLDSPLEQQLARVKSEDQPVFVSVTSSREPWQAAVGELVQELQYVARNTPDREWDFAIAFITGHSGDDVVLEATRLLDKRLGTNGCFLGVDAEFANGTPIPQGPDSQETTESEENTEQCKITVTAMRLPRKKDGSLYDGVQGARPFAIGKEELMEISMLTLKLQETPGAQVYNQTGVNNATTLAWRKYLGIEEEPQGILLFADPGASDYTMKQVLGSLDLTFPTACKVGGVCAPNRECRLVVAGAPAEKPAGAQGKVAGLVLPSSVALHALVSRAGFKIGPDLQVTKAEGHLVTEINGESPQKAIAEACRSVGPLDEVLVNRNGLLMGIDSQRELVRPPAIGPRSEKPKSAREQSRQYLVRSFQFMPGGELYVRSHNFNRVPPHVGEPRKNVKLHVRDDYRAHEDCMMMLKRYSVARLCFQETPAPSCSGAIIFHCNAWTAGVGELQAELQSMLGKDALPVTSATLRGEIGPSGVNLGGVDARPTDRHGHAVLTCLFCHSPPSKVTKEPVDEIKWKVS